MWSFCRHLQVLRQSVSLRRLASESVMAMWLAASARHQAAKQDQQCPHRVQHSLTMSTNVKGDAFDTETKAVAYCSLFATSRNLSPLCSVNMFRRRKLEQGSGLATLILQPHITQPGITTSTGNERLATIPECFGSLLCHGLQ